jgi:hypothetical protein
MVKIPDRRLLDQYRRPMRVMVVVVLAGEKLANLPAVLRSTIVEAANFYNLGKMRLSIDSKVYFRNEASSNKLVEADYPDFQPIYDEDLEKARGEFLDLYDQWKLIKVVRKRISESYSMKKVVIITDLEIVPPPDWRYILWESDEHNAVISLAAMDPEYWGIKERSPLITIKQRVRASMLGIIGDFLKLERCLNPSCFLYGDVNSADQLDDMICMGEEHSVENLTFMGYNPRPGDPVQVQKVQRKSPHNKGQDKK